jgi:hypothetical protein
MLLLALLLLAPTLFALFVFGLFLWTRSRLRPRGRPWVFGLLAAAVLFQGVSWVTLSNSAAALEPWYSLGIGGTLLSCWLLLLAFWRFLADLPLPRHA